MSEERKKILEMLAEGKITAVEAERLLDKLAAGADSSDQAGQASGEPSAPPQKPRFLRILVDSPDRNQVNIRVPVSFMRAGMKLMAVVPRQVSEKLAEKGIDLSALADMKGEDLTEALRQLNLDVDGRDGKKVRIFCE